jgi:hypothetical protein
MVGEKYDDVGACKRKIDCQCHKRNITPGTSGQNVQLDTKSLFADQFNPNYGSSKGLLIT